MLSRSLAVPLAIVLAASVAHADDICGDGVFYTPDAWDADCQGLKLLAASGVPQEKQHSYSFSGTCKVIYNCESGGKLLQTVPAEASAKWDGAKKEFAESFKVLAPFKGNGWKIDTGKVSTIFKCNDDPLITSAACGYTQHSNKSSYAAFSNPALKQNRPLVKGKVTLAEAEALSKASASSGGSANPATPPPPKKKSEWSAAPKATQKAQPPAAVLPKAGLTVIGVQPKVAPVCPGIAQVFTAGVSIRNSTLPIPANKGHVSVAETWGANLKSSDVALPAFASNEVKVVQIPVGLPKVSVPSLPGSHKLAVVLVPVQEKGQPSFAMPSENFVFSVTFPSGYCQQNAQPGGAGGEGGAQSGSQLPPAQSPREPPRQR